MPAIMFHTFDTKKECQKFLDDSWVMILKHEKKKGGTVAERDGKKVVVPKDANGIDRLDKAVTSGFDIPHKAANGAGWFCQCPYKDYPELKKAMDHKPGKLPKGWLLDIEPKPVKKRGK